MAENNGSGKGIYFIVGALVVAVAVLAFMKFGGGDEPDLSISVGGEKIEINTPD